MNHISTPILFKDLSAQEQERLTRTWVNNALTALAPKRNVKKPTIEQLETLSDYFLTSMAWESGFCSDSKEMTQFYQRTMDKAIRGVLDMRTEEPAMILVMADNPTDCIKTSPITEIAIYPNGYARITTCDAVYNFWNPIYGMTMKLMNN